MVHAEALTGPGGIVLDDRAPLDPFARWVVCDQRVQRRALGRYRAWLQARA